MGFDPRYERDYNIFTPTSRYAPDNPLNPVNKYDPDSAFNPVNRYDPGNPTNPINQYNPNNPFNPVNRYHPDNPLNPVNKYNPDVPFEPLDGVGSRGRKRWEEAIRIQETLRDRIILKNTFLKVHPVRNSSRALNPARMILGSNSTRGGTAEQRGIISNGVKTIGAGDVAYSKNGNHLFGAMVVLSVPSMEILDMATLEGKTPFPYIPSLLSFREGPIRINIFRNLKIKPDVLMIDGQGMAHPRGMGLASHMGLWFNLPSIGCAKTPLLDEFICPGPLRGSFEWIRREGKKVGVVLRTKDKVNPLFVSPGHRIDLKTSIQLVLESCQGFRMPEPLRKAHHASLLARGEASKKS